jgi:hypothetical protein
MTQEAGSRIPAERVEGDVSFLNQLKNQADALQKQQTAKEQDIAGNTARCEAACKVAHHYLGELARQLNVLSPDGPKLTLDGKTPWPAMKLAGFRSDARKKMLRDKEAYDFIAMGWDIVPKVGMPVGGVVTVNFPPELERVQSRISLGLVEHERKDQRHPETNKLQAYRFEYLTKTRGSLTITPDHDNGTMSFRLLNVDGFAVHTVKHPAEAVRDSLLDEMAKLLVGQPSKFI